MKFIFVTLFVMCAVLIGNTLAKNPICYQKFKFNAKRTDIKCMGTQTMWGYHARSGKCADFEYNPVCGGNDNLFGTKEICEKICVFSDDDPVKNFAESTNCSDPHSEEGDCRASIPSWTFNQYARQCVEFTYGGCHGNRNRFASYQECAKQCLR